MARLARAKRCRRGHWAEAYLSCATRCWWDLQGVPPPQGQACKSVAAAAWPDADARSEHGAAGQPVEIVAGTLVTVADPIADVYAPHHPEQLEVPGSIAEVPDGYDRGHGGSDVGNDFEGFPGGHAVNNIDDTLVRALRGRPQVRRDAAGEFGATLRAGEFGTTLRVLRLIQRKAASLGLELNLGKCEVIPTAGRNTECNLAEFPAIVQRKVDGCFKLLGAPVGGQEHCAEHVEVKRVQKLTALLDEVPFLEGAQVAHKLLSRCFGAARLMPNMRTTRPDWITRGLERSQQARRSTFQICTGTGLNESQWQQIDAAFSWDGDCDARTMVAAANLYNVGARQEHHITSEDFAADGSFPSQRARSMKVDERLSDQLIAASPNAHKARLRAASAPHASAWLQAQPCSALGQRMSHFEFLAAVHNALRDQVHSFAHAAGLQAEKEESGLLPDDPRRRPGDINFPTWPLGPPLALDCAGEKLADRDTGVRCEQLGIRLAPKVVESFGGWGEMAQDALWALIHARAARSGETAKRQEEASAQID
ncbi:unnamed protein product [Prorocentrum cordatum]|uniref:RNA-directed RNA polymerase n=1 Tax=Prorocentrum cordatum TaxID=2364126 RepID=A0ABN9Y1T8_9DINO|nr:unnamed protein product [Polarella glacialis]